MGRRRLSAAPASFGADFRRLADIEEIRRYYPQRFEMEQLTAIVYENLQDKLCVGYKDVTLGPRPHVFHAAHAGCRHARSLGAIVQLLHAEVRSSGGEDGRTRRPACSRTIRW
jgi:hypothetical protein